ncbi:MAG: hypothetical protein DA408_17295 [Bacteroidetes bacterium]|nr:MAG: hypothetical protein C7N36_05255 [Bacteroidota bacterium]PTM09927.1 MAG: hypothetical protein DA408_17295 [Bacteroidota bacterium]
MPTYYHLRRAVVFAVLLFLCAGATLRAAATFEAPVFSWKLMKSTNNIKVYQRSSDQSSIDEIRIKAVFKTELNHFLTLLSDASRYPEWVFKCSGSRRVRTVSPTEFYYYVLTDFPWPLADRDLVVHSTQHHDPVTGDLILTSRSAPKFVEEVSNVVRIQLFATTWRVTTPQPNQVNIDYQVVTDPAGSLPDWVVNLGLTRGPLQTMINFTELVER